MRWHWKKAGTIEHLHDVTKNELGAGTLPCGRFGANAAWYRLSLITYNVISAMKSLALSSTFSSARPKRIRFAVFAVAGRLVSHARRLVVRVSKEAEQIAGLIEARARRGSAGPVGRGDRAASGVTVNAPKGNDMTRRLDAVVFENAPATKVAGGRAALDRALDMGLILIAADAVGGSHRCLEMTTEYALQRERFGQVIGAFQAVKHQLANMATDVEPAMSPYW